MCVKYLTPRRDLQLGWEFWKSTGFIPLQMIFTIISDPEYLIKNPPTIFQAITHAYETTHIYAMSNAPWATQGLKWQHILNPHSLSVSSLYNFYGAPMPNNGHLLEIMPAVKQLSVQKISSISAHIISMIFCSRQQAPHYFANIQNAQLMLE